MSLEVLIRTAQRRGLDVLAITDHDNIDGALEMARIAPFPVIVGEEIGTADGEIIGLFLHEAIPSGMSPQETVEAIRTQGGIIYLPHPLDQLRRGSLTRRALREIVHQVDAVEIFNARVTFPGDNAKAAHLAKAHGLPGGGGSDAHSPFEIGRSYVDMPPFFSRDSFLEQLRRGRVWGVPSPPWVHLTSAYAKQIKKRAK